MLVSRLQDAWPELDESSTVDRVCAAPKRSDNGRDRSFKTEQ
jgi:hypothetical protein